jgi:glycosyltransferase involved in cell wall biosynthesis
MVSIVTPALNERFLRPTILDALAKAKGEVEVIAVCDGYRPPNEEIVRDDRVKYLFKGDREGMRPAINDGVSISNGDYIFKLDSHCLLSNGYDEVLKANCEPNWVVIPQRRRLDAENWCEQIQDNPIKKPNIDYERLSYPSDNADWGGAGLNGRVWTERILERQDKPEYNIDKNMSFQGSGWFTTKKHFEIAKIFEDTRWKSFWNEAQNISFRTVLCDYLPYSQLKEPIGSVMVNKMAYFCHLHKGQKYGRGYKLVESELTAGRNMALKFYKGEKVWDDQTRPLSFLIEQFFPLPEWDNQKLDLLKERERAKGWSV